MDKESVFELQKTDCNCNDCWHLTRNLAKYKEFDYLYTNKKGQVTSPSHRINYGFCNSQNKDVSFIPNVCQIENQKCFLHRKEKK
jgi:hypothetical protein